MSPGTYKRPEDSHSATYLMPPDFCYRVSSLDGHPALKGMEQTGGAVGGKAVGDASGLPVEIGATSAEVCMHACGSGGRVPSSLVSHGR